MTSPHASFYAISVMNILQNINVSNLTFPISSQTAQSYLNITITLLIAVLVDNLFRSFVKVPKTFDSKRAETYVTIFRNIITLIVYGVALHIIFVELGIDITPLLASAGIISVIIGIGARAIIEDLITGLFLISQHSISIGDYIKIDDTEGYIMTIGFRTLTIRAHDGSLSIIPNGQIKKLINFSRTRSHVIVDLPVKTDEDITKVLKAMNDALDQLKKDEALGKYVQQGSAVRGIEEFKAIGPMIVRTTILTNPNYRFDIGRKYRFFAKKEFEKNKIQFG